MSKQGRARSMPERVSHAWDSVARGMAPDPLDLDPTLIETMQRLHSLGGQPRPDAAFAERLEEELMRSQADALLRHLTPYRLLTTEPNGKSPPRPLPPSATWSGPSRSRGRWLASFATAALVLLTLIGSFVVIHGPLRLVSHKEHPAIIPAIDSTLESNLPPGVTEDTVLFDHVFNEIPVGSDWAGVERTSLAPGAVMNQGTPETSGVGPMLYRVEVGSVTGQVDGPIEVTRAGATTASQVDGNAAVALEAGDVAFVPPGVASHWRNTGSSPATILDAGVSLPGGVNGGEWVDGTLLSFDALIDASAIEPPPAPSELTVHRLTIEPGAILPGEPAAGLKLVGVESGTLTIVWAKRTDPTVQTGTHETPAGTWMDINSAGLFAKELRNDGAEPLTILVMTVEPVAASPATPVAPAAALSTDPAADTVLMQGTFDTIPQLANWEGIARATLAPGTEMALGKSENDGEGPMLYRVEFGELTIRADGPISVTRAGTSAPVTIPPGTDVVLQEGDQGYTPSGVTSRWRNARQVPAVVLDAGFTTSAQGVLSQGVSHDAVAWTYGSPPKKPVAVVVHRSTLPAATALAAQNLLGLQTLYVESGTIEVVDAKHLATTANPLSTAAAGKLAQTIGPGSFYSAADQPENAVRVTDAGPATLLIMTVVDAATGKALPMS
jgi:hypothetical protein